MVMAKLGAKAGGPKGRAVPVATEISNIERRGHVYYWRARVPARVPDARTPEGKYARFSLSLHQSDHRKACYMARRLNTLLAELTLGTRAAMTDKDKLEQIFRTEIDRMSAHLDDVAMVGRRSGRSDDVREMETDIEVGWANRLIQLFGAGRKLSFDAACPGRAMLVKAGIPEDCIPAIADTFEGERLYARSRMFEDELRQEMGRGGLTDTVANRERAKIEFFRARADALLDVADRWPMIDRQSTAMTRSTLPEADRHPVEPAEPPKPAPEPEAVVVTAPAPEPVVPTVPPSKASEAVSLPEVDVQPISAAIGNSAPAPEAVISPPIAAAPQISTTPEASIAPTADRPVLPLSGFVAEWQKMVDNHKEEWREDTASDARVLVCLFRDILEENGVRHSGEIRQHHVAALRDHFNWMPAKYGQSSRLRAMKPSRLRAFAAAERDKDPTCRIGLSNVTIRKHWGNLGSFLKHVRGQGYAIAELQLNDLRPRKPSKKGLRTKQPKPYADEVRPLFELPIFTGCEGPRQRQRGQPGPFVYHSALYFLPMLFVYLGARRAEVAGLDVAAVRMTESGPAINLAPNDVRGLKTEQSERMVPVPVEMLRLGFMDYVDRLRALGHTLLFPELFSPHLDRQDPGDRFYKEFSPLVERSPQFADGVWPRLIHALRHGFADAAFQNGVDSAIVDDISGRMGNTETTTRYTNVAGLPRLINDLKAIPIVTDHLQLRPLKLLPWVEAKEPPPWAGRKMTRKQLAELHEMRRQPRTR